MLKEEEGRTVDQLESHLAIDLKAEMVPVRREAIDDRVLHLLRCAVDGRARLEDRRDLSIGRALDRARIEETPKGRLPLLGADATDEEEKDGAGGDRIYTY